MVVADAVSSVTEVPPPLSNDISLLASVPIFRNLAQEELEQLAAASRRVVFQPGEVLVRKGEQGECVYVILEGRVEVLANEAVVSWLIAGDTVGDMSLFDGRPRSATCVALAPTTCLRLDREAFLTAAQRNWSMTLGLFSVLADRIRQADDLLADHARDPLTGVNNRRALLDLYQREANRTQRAARQGPDHALNPLAVVFCDVDKFKSINDTYGHHVGDQVLIAVAQLLTQAGRATDFVARYGGDEFVMLLPDAGQTGADAVMQRIRDLVTSNPPGPVPFTISLGAAVVDPLDPPSYEEVMTAADAEMYRDKARTR